MLPLSSCQLTVLLSTNRLLSFSRGLRTQINHLNMSEGNRWQWSINIAISQLEQLPRERAIAVSGGHLALLPLCSQGSWVSPLHQDSALSHSHHTLIFLSKAVHFSYSIFNRV